MTDDIFLTKGAYLVIDAKNYRRPEKLKNGFPVTIRAIRPDDKDRVVKAFKNLDPESIYTRFFSFITEITDKALRTVTEVDFEKTVALVVTIPAEGKEETIIGAGRYVLTDSASGSAEIAFLVEEDYHGQGIASTVLRHLTLIAREKGLSQFEAVVLPQNKSMLAVFARSGLPMKQWFEEGTVCLTLSLTGAPAPTGSY